MNTFVKFPGTLIVGINGENRKNNLIFSNKKVNTTHFKK
jgi:hypothetical protein